MKMKIPVLVLLALLAHISFATDNQNKNTCDNKIIECVNKVSNQENHPVTAESRNTLIKNRLYFIVYWSKWEQDTLNVSCAQNLYRDMNGVNYYYKDDQSMPLGIPYTWDIIDGTGVIKNFNINGLSLNIHAHFAYFGSCCFGSYYCEDTEQVLPHWQIHCKSNPSCKKECRDEANKILGLLKSCGAEDIIANCKDKWDN